MNASTRSRVSAVLAQWLARVVLIALIPIGASPLLSPPAEAQTALSIGTAKDPNLASQIAIARAKGLFKEAGLDVNVNYFPSGGDLMAAVVGRSVEIGSSGATPMITLRARPYPIKILSQIADISGAEQIIVRSSIARPEDLYGKKIAIMKNTGSQALFESFVKAYDFDASRVELVYMAPTEMIASFSRGDVDAIAVWEPFTTRARKLFNGKMLVSGTRSEIPDKQGDRRIYGDHSVLFATEEFIQKEPKTIKAVLTALAAACDLIESNRSEASGILAKEFGFDQADMNDIMTENNYTLALNDELVGDIDRLTDFLYGLKSIQSKPEARTWIDAAYLREVRPQLVTLK
jgi:ABC-type nitrate/sulfonate/bicarbonate transport system substrate-binding protein